MSKTMNFNMAKFCMACLVGTAMVIGAGSAHAQSNNWSGTNSSSWFDSANWDAPNVRGDIDATSSHDFMMGPNNDPIVAGIPTIDNDPAGTGVVFIGHQNVKGSGNLGEVNNPATAFPLSDGNTLGFGDYPVVGAGEVAKAQRLFFGGDTDGYNDAYLSKLTVQDGGSLQIAGTGGASFFLGRSASASDVPALPATSPNVLLEVLNGGKIQVGNVLDPLINGGLLPSGPADIHWGQGTINVLIDGAGSELNISNQLRGTGRFSAGTSPKPGSGIKISNGGLLEVGTYRMDRFNDIAGFVNISGPDSSMVVNAVSLFTHGLEDGSGGEHPELHGPGETIDGATASTLEKLLHIIDHGSIIATTADMVTPNRVLVTDLGGGSFQLTSVPEPSTMVLLGMAFAGFVVRRRR